MFKRITELGDDHREVRRPTPLAEIADVARASPEEVEACIGHFAEPGRSFVTVSTDGVVDISHESLIRQWPRLKAWVREEADSRDVYRRLANAADRWERGEAALLRDPELQIAVAVVDGHPAEPGVGRPLPPRLRTRGALPRAEPEGGAATSSQSVRGRRPRSRCSRSSPCCSPGGRTSRRTRADEQRRTAIARQLAASSAEAGAASRSVSILSAIEAVRIAEQDGPRLPAAEEALRRAMQDPTGVKLPSGPAVEGHPVRTAFSPDGAVVATGGQDGKVRLWPVAPTPDPEAHVLPGEGAPISALAISPDGRWLAAGRDDGVLALWDLTSPEDGHQELTHHALGINTMAFSPDSRSLVTGSDDTSALLWNLADPSDPTPLPGQESFVLSLAFSPDGTKIVTGANDGVARVWTVDDIGGRPDAPSRPRTRRPCCRLQPGRTVGGDGGRGRTGRRLGPGPPDGPRSSSPTRGPSTRWPSAAMEGGWRPGATTTRPGCGTCATPPSTAPVPSSWSTTTTSRPWRSAAPARSKAVPVTGWSPGAGTARRGATTSMTCTPTRWCGVGTRGTVATVAFSAGDRWVATGSDDGTARLWSLEHPVHPAGRAGPRRRRRRGDRGGRAIAFSPDGRRLATGYERQDR